MYAIRVPKRYPGRVASGCRLIPHTADMRLSARGGTLEEDLSAALAGLVEVVLGPRPVERTGFEDWQSAVSEPRLAMVELLSEALFQLQVRRRAVLFLRGDLVRARLGVGELPRDVALQREVKAVTYNEPLCERMTDGRWTCEVTLDL